jgi:hypothetical protein
MNTKSKFTHFALQGALTENSEYHTGNSLLCWIWRWWWCCCSCCRTSLIFPTCCKCVSHLLQMCVRKRSSQNIDIKKYMFFSLLCMEMWRRSWAHQDLDPPPPVSISKECLWGTKDYDLRSGNQIRERSDTKNWTLSERACSLVVTRAPVAPQVLGSTPRRSEFLRI